MNVAVLFNDELLATYEARTTLRPAETTAAVARVKSELERVASFTRYSRYEPPTPNDRMTVKVHIKDDVSVPAPEVIMTYVRRVIETSGLNPHEIETT
jgi:hypothetical protein